MIDKKLNYGRHVIRRFLEGSVASPAVLDLGAGFGDDLMIAKEACANAKLIACEAYPPYQEGLKARGVQVFSCDIEHERLPFGEEEIDIVICNQIFEHCKEIWWMMHEISRVLKVNGVLIIGIPNLASVHNRLLLSLGKQPTSIRNDGPHVRGYTKSDFVSFIHSGFTGGYALEDFEGSNFYPFPPAPAKLLARIFPTGSVGIFFKFRKKKNYVGETFLRYPVNNKLETTFYLGSSALPSPSTEEPELPVSH